MFLRNAFIAFFFISELVLAQAPSLSTLSFMTTVPHCSRDQSVLVTNTTPTGPNSWARFYWNWGDGSPIVQGANAMHIYSAAGTYTITMRAETNWGARDSIRKMIMITYPPKADFSTTNACEGTLISFHNLSTGNAPIVAATWNFGDGSPLMNTVNAQHAYSSPGNYVVTLAVSDSFGCRQVIQQPLTVYPQPAINLSYQAKCSKDSVDLSAHLLSGSTGVSSWEWQLGANTSVIKLDTAIWRYRFTGGGKYFIRLIGTTSHGCKDTIAKYISVNASPLAKFKTLQTKGCGASFCINFVDQSAMTDNSAQPLKSFWEFGDGSHCTTLAGTSVQHCYAIAGQQPGSWKVKLRVVTDSLCEDTTTLPYLIQLYPKPKAAYTVSDSVISIENPLVNFTNHSSNFTSFIWNFGEPNAVDITHCNTTSWIYKMNDAGQYQSSLVVRNDYGCSDTARRVIRMPSQFTFYIPNAFTPNKDGRNDQFRGYGTGITSYRLWIYDRWGKEVFYSDTLEKGWSGDAGAEKEDVYVWKVELEETSGKSHSYIGHVTLLL